MAEEVWNYVADGLEQTGRTLAAAARAALGTPVRVAPFDDDVSAKLGVWLRGDKADLDQVREALDVALGEAGIVFSALRWEESGRRG